MKDGQGTYQFPDGKSFYKGEWKNDRKNGAGVMTWVDGDGTTVFDGTWFQGERKTGTLKKPDGSSH